MVDKILWAKKSLGKDGLPKWLPLYQHLLDTKFIIGMLYEHYLSEHQRMIINNSLSPLSDDLNAKNLLEFIGITHDIGKATPAFQMKESYQGIDELDQIMLKDLFNNGYLSDDFMDYPLPYDKKSPHALAGEAILEKMGVNKGIGSIIGGHHGKPLNDNDIADKNIKKYAENYYSKINNDNPIYVKWIETQNEFFDWALEKTGYKEASDLPKIKNTESEVIIEGLLIMADWIASNDNYFPLFDEDQFETSDLISRLHNGWKKWFKTTIWMPESNSDSKHYYQEKFGFLPREFQTKIFDKIQESKDPGIIIIESGMGSGKTEASLSAVEQLAKKHNCDGLFYCLPTQATTNAMFSRVKEWLSVLASDDDEDRDIQLVHGKAALNDDFSELPHNIDIGEEKDAGVIVNQWFYGSKTAMLDDFVVGTIDQLLLLALKKKHLALRHLGFSGKVVVIDEAHGFDAYMQSYLYRALEWLGKYHIPVVILSATLPAEKRMNFINAYLDKKDINHNVKNNLSYPLVSYSDGTDVKVIDSFTPSNYSKTVQINSIGSDNLLSKLKNLLSGGGVCGIVVNTVHRAQSLGKELINIFGEDSVEILHSSFIATDRSKKEDKLLGEIGKNNYKRPKLKIVIGTQVLEQSLDIDFDVMFTDLAPMDLILQRVGRLHRHDDNDNVRPSKLSSPKCYILEMSPNYEYESGASFIYGDALLIRTQFYLPDKIELPNDISTLIQNVYNFNLDLDLPLSIKSKYYDAFNDYKEKIKNNETSATTFMIDKCSNMHNNLFGWLNDLNEQDLDSSDAKGLAQVRDGEESVEVIIVKSQDDGDYSFVGSNKCLRDKINSGDVKFSKQLAQNTINLPKVLSQNYNIESTIDYLERYNKMHLSSWQQQSWLKGSLGIILDENNQFPLNEFVLSYDQKLGLSLNKTE